MIFQYIASRYEYSAGDKNFAQKESLCSEDIATMLANLTSTVIQNAAFQKYYTEELIEISIENPQLSKEEKQQLAKERASALVAKDQAKIKL